MTGTKDMKKRSFSRAPVEFVAPIRGVARAAARRRSLVGTPLRTITAVCAVGVLTGCPEVRDEPADDGEPPTRVATADLTIGAAEGADELIFSRISGLTSDRRGRIYVADLESHEVRVFEESGRLAYRIGRKGQGPGELQQPCCIALQNGDSTLWVRDNGNSRYTSFALGDTGARYRSMVRAVQRDGNRWAPLTFDAQGQLIDIGSRPSNEPGESQLVRFHLDSAGRVVREDTIAGASRDSVPVHTVNRKVPNGFAIMYVWPLFGPEELNAHGPNGERARAISSRYSIAWYATDGRLARTLERPVEAPLLSAAEREQAERSIQDYMKRLSIPRGEIPFGVEDRKQPLRDLFFDQDGRLWVELSVADGTAPSAHVYSREGRLLFTAQWPARTSLSNGAARGDVAYGIQRDSLDVQKVVRLVFR